MISGWVPFVFAGGNFLMPKAERPMIPGGAKGQCVLISRDGQKGRSGHLFQNRLKSIICEEDLCVLELVRQIHLKPPASQGGKERGGVESLPLCSSQREARHAS